MNKQFQVFKQKKKIPQNIKVDVLQSLPQQNINFDIPRKILVIFKQNLGDIFHLSQFIHSLLVLY